MSFVARELEHVFEALLNALDDRFEKSIGMDLQRREGRAAFTRIPHHDMIRPLPTVGSIIGRGRRAPKRAMRQRATAFCDITQITRVTMTASDTASAHVR